MFSHNDNAPAQTIVLGLPNLVYLGYTLQFHSTCTPCLACATLFYSKVEKSLAGRKFESNHEVFAATKPYFADLKKTHFSDLLRKLKPSWVKCIERMGDLRKLLLFPNFCFPLASSLLDRPRTSFCLLKAWHARPPWK